MRPYCPPEPPSPRWNFTSAPILSGPVSEPFNEPCFRLGDIRDWVDVGTLIAWLDEEIANLCANPATLRPGFPGMEAESSKSILYLLAYAYATEVLDSAEISRNCETQTVFRLLSGEALRCPPHWHRSEDNTATLS